MPELGDTRAHNKLRHSRNTSSGYVNYNHYSVESARKMVMDASKLKYGQGGEFHRSNNEALHMTSSMSFVPNTQESVTDNHLKQRSGKKYSRTSYQIPRKVIANQVVKGRNTIITPAKSTIHEALQPSGKRSQSYNHNNK